MQGEPDRVGISRFGISFIKPVKSILLSSLCASSSSPHPVSVFTCRYHSNLTCIPNKDMVWVYVVLSHLLGSKSHSSHMVMFSLSITVPLLFSSANFIRLARSHRPRQSAWLEHEVLALSCKTALDILRESARRPVSHRIHKTIHDFLQRGCSVRCCDRHYHQVHDQYGLTLPWTTFVTLALEDSFDSLQSIPPPDRIAY